MNFFSDNILTLILFSPIISAMVILLLPKDQKSLIRWVAFILSIIPFIFSLILWFNFNTDESGFQFTQQVTWYSPLNVSYHVGGGEQHDAGRIVGEGGDDGGTSDGFDGPREV